MIQRLRSRHWWTILVLAIVLPILFVLALASRQDPPARNRPLHELGDAGHE
jgi:hypothetical protein